MTFEECNIGPELIRAVTEMGFTSPTPIQESLIPLLLDGDVDVIGLAQTGTGKTAAFGLPLLKKLETDSSSGKNPRMLVLCPTRELCVQITGELEKYARYLSASCITAVYGGADIKKQIQAVKRGTDIIAATPGRLLDLMNRNIVNLYDLKYLVLDEADIMLDMGFKDELDAILSAVPVSRQTVLLSATMPPEVARIAEGYMDDPEEVVVGKRNAGTDMVEHSYVMVRSKEKYRTLKRLADYHPDVYGIVFCRTRAETQNIADRLIRDGYDADALHGDLSQSQRDWVMKRFRERNLHLLVATDIAARGLDVEELTHIIHFDLPDDPGVYTHRSGRTGRAGRTGASISIITDKEYRRIKRIERTVKRTISENPIPTGKDICEKQLYHLADRIKDTEVDEELIAPFMERVMDRFSGLDREDILKHVVANEFSKFLTYYKEDSDISSASPADSGSRKTKDRSGSRKNGKNGISYTPIKINLGRQNRIVPEQLIGLINQSTRNRNIRIGRIDIQQNHSRVEVESANIAEVQDSLESFTYKGRTLKIEKGGTTFKGRGRRRNKNKYRT